MKQLTAAILCLCLTYPAIAADLDDTEIRDLTRTAISGLSTEANEAARTLAERGQQDVVSSLILGLRYRGRDGAIREALSELTGTPIQTWEDGILWQEANPDVVPHPSYQELKVDILEQIDAKFVRFLQGERGQREYLDIRLEEVVWGGVKVDGIPSLDNPTLIPASEADYLEPEDLVFGVSINGDTRAYPLRIMGWHEMFNEVIGGVPVALAYCTLCGAGILFETQLEGRDKPLVFGSSGLLYRSNKLMFDRETDSLWNQFTGEPVSGPLRDQGITLKIRPVTTTTWAAWNEKHPNGKVLSLDTGYIRNYGSGVVYADYFSSPDLMFPTLVGDESLVKRKNYVFGIRDVGVSRAWPVAAFENEPIINDFIGTRPIVLIGNAASRTVRAYERGAHEFQSGTKGVTANGQKWEISEDFLINPEGERLARVPGHLSFWFAWNGYLGAESTLYGQPK